jgi:hypothetical protein
MQQQPKSRTIGFVLGTADADIYAVPNNYEAEIVSIVITNTTTAYKTFSLGWYDAESTDTYKIAEDTEIRNNGIVQITQPLWLRKGDKLSGSAAADDSVTVSVIVTEYFIPLQY